MIPVCLLHVILKFLHFFRIEILKVVFFTGIFVKVIKFKCIIAL